MKKPAPPHTGDHRDDLLLSYVEGLLEPQDAKMVEEHLMKCSQCSSDAEELRQTLALLGENREAFCPEAWEVYEYLHYGQDPDGLVARHLDQCALCRDTVLSCAEKSSPEAMPDELWAGIRQRLPLIDKTTLSEKAESDTWIERFFRFFRFPALAAGVAVAAMLAIVLLGTPDMPQSVITLSTVTWEKAPKPKGFQQSATRAAVLLVFKDFEEKLPQGKIDALYEALVPPMELHDRFHVVAPATIKESLNRSDLKLRDTKAVVEALSRKLALSAVLIVTVVPRGEGTNVEMDVVDSASGMAKAHKTETDVLWSNLAETIRRSGFDLLLQAG